MATTAALASSRANSLRYLITSSGDGAALTIPNDAGATPDLQTDSAGFGGPLRQMILSRLNGYGALAAGAKTQAQARSMFMGDGSAAGNANIPRAETTLTPRTGLTVTWLIDANVDGDGDPTIVVTPSAVAGTAYLDITVPSMIGS